MVDKINRTALITGGSGGIGSNICENLASKNIKVLFTYFKNKKKAEKIKKKIREKGGQAFTKRLDISNLKSIEKTMEGFYRDHKKIDILINNSGISQIKQFTDITTKDFDRIIDINLKGPFFLTKLFLKRHKKTNWCRIINISSISGLKGGKMQIHYAMTKAGILSITKSLDNIYGRKNFTINAIAPGLINTGMIKKELSIKRKNNLKIGKVKDADEVTKVINKIISDKFNNQSGKIFKL